MTSSGPPADGAPAACGSSPSFVDPAVGDRLAGHHLGRAGWPARRTGPCSRSRCASTWPARRPSGRAQRATPARAAGPGGAGRGRVPLPGANRQLALERLAQRIASARGSRRLGGPPARPGPRRCAGLRASAVARRSSAPAARPERTTDRPGRPPQALWRWRADSADQTSSKKVAISAVSRSGLRRSSKTAAGLRGGAPGSSVPGTSATATTYPQLQGSGRRFGGHALSSVVLPSDRRHAGPRVRRHAPRSISSTRTPSGSVQ